MARFREVPSLEIYEALREPTVPGVALVHFRWDGNERHLVGLLTVSALDTPALERLWDALAERLQRNGLRPAG